jgi:hypothetical protein
VIAYKLFRQLKNGEITPLFINKKKRLPFNEWMDAECHPTKGFVIRPFWHCTSTPNAPHLSEKNRVWLKVEIEEFTEYQRPDNQGGKWYLANRLRIIEYYDETSTL